MMQIQEVCSDADTREVVSLLRDFVEWLRVRYAPRLWIVDKYFDPVAWDQELMKLRERYSPPGGAMLLARIDGLPVGCVLYRDLGEATCEMKRMFVRPVAHGMGVGKALSMELMRLAKARGFARMRLDTGPLQPEAQRMYEASGFVDIACYYDCPEDLRAELRFMECRL